MTKNIYYCFKNFLFLFCVFQKKKVGAKVESLTLLYIITVKCYMPNYFAKKYVKLLPYFVIFFLNV